MGKQISFSSQGKQIPAELFQPSGSLSTGVVIIAYGSDGLTDNLSGPWKTMIQGYAESLVQANFVALIPDYFACTGTSPGAAAFDSISLCRDKWQMAISDAIDHARSIPQVDSSRIGLLGFSLGGHLCLRTRNKAKILVSFFAPIFDGLGSAGNLSHAQIHHGKSDQLVPWSNAGEIKSVLDSEGTVTHQKDYQMANHGFVGTDPDNTKARSTSKEETLTFFQSHL